MIITNSAEIRAALEHDQEVEDEVRDQAARSQQELMLTATQELPALPNFEETGLWSLIAAWSELPMQDGHALEYAARVESCIGEIMRAYARAASAAVQAELNAAQAIIADRDAAEEERIFAKPLRTVDSKEPIGKLCIEDGNRTRTVHSEWAEGAFALPAGEYAIYGHPTVAAQSLQEPVAWKQAYEEEARKFQQETLRTSKLACLLLRWVRDAHDRGCRNDKIGNKCGQCDLMRDTEALLAMPINAHPPKQYSEEEGEAYMSGWFDGRDSGASPPPAVQPAEADHDTEHEQRWPNAVTPAEVPKCRKTLGWKFNHTQKREGDEDDEGVWEIGYLDSEDDRFSPILTVDTGLYYQDKDAEPLARAILARIATKDGP